MLQGFAIGLICVWVICGIIDLYENTSSYEDENKDKD